MSINGPVVLVSARSSNTLVAAIHAAGATPVEASWEQAPQRILKTWPAAVIFNDDAGSPSEYTSRSIESALDGMSKPYLPVLARVGRDSGPAIARALPIAAEASDAHVVARLASALRVRALHAAVFRRAATLSADGTESYGRPDADPLDDATVLVAGRGRSYPALTTAVGERVGLIGAMNVETAARYLTARPLDGIVLGDGFSQPMMDAFLTALMEDARFRDLPVAVLQGAPVSVDCKSMPNFERIDGEPDEVVAWMLPLVRQHAHEARLQRQLAAIEAKGMLDPQTGLFTIETFLRDLDRSIDDAKNRKQAMSLARFSFLPFVDRRTALDAARLASRLVRSVDFACRASDGSILLCFPSTALRDAHVIARRIAISLKGTMLSADGAPQHDPIVTLAALKPADTTVSLLMRVSEPVKVAAE